MSGHNSTGQPQGMPGVGPLSNSAASSSSAQGSQTQGTQASGQGATLPPSQQNQQGQQDGGNGNAGVPGSTEQQVAVLMEQFTLFLQNANQATAANAGDAGAASSASTTTPPSNPFSAKSLRRLPPIDPAADTSAFRYDVPKECLTAYSEGHYIPFNCLTDESLEYYAAHPPTSSRKLLPDSSVDSNEHYNFDSSAEGSLDVAKYDQAVRNFLRIVLKVTPDEVPNWKTHFDYLQTYHRREVYHPALLQYCIWRRQKRMGSGIDVGKIDESALMRYITQLEMTQYVAANSPSSFPSAPTSFPRYNPYPTTVASRGSGFRGRGSFRGRGRGAGHSHAESSNKPKGVQPCLICAATDHWAQDCTATTQANGRPVYATRSSDGTLRDPNGKVFCWKFNNNSCSFSAEQCYRNHTCTGCGSPSHARADRRC